MKVAIIHPHIFAGGAEKAIVHLAYQLNRLGHEATVCTLSTRLDELPSIAANVEYVTPAKPVPLPKLEGTMSTLRSVVSEANALKELAKASLDDCDLLAPCNFPAYWSTHGLNGSKPVVWISSEVFGPYNASRDIHDRSMLFRSAVKGAAMLDRYIVRKSVDEIVTCSELNRELIKERYGLDAAVIPTGVDYEFFSDDCSGAKEQLGLEDNYVLLHVGALVKRKNQMLSIRALQRLKSRIPTVKLILVGEGPWDSSLRSEASELGLEGDVVFAGCVSEERLRLLYHACDVNHYPVEDQTYGLVPFEAFAAGKPSLVSQQSGAGLMMAEEGLGYLIQPDLESIVDGVFRLQDGRERDVRELVERGRSYVRNLSWDRYAGRMVQLFENTVQVSAVTARRDERRSSASN